MASFIPDETRYGQVRWRVLRLAGEESAGHPPQDLIYAENIIASFAKFLEASGESPDRDALITYRFLMTLNVSVPEKTLEHWASLCIAYRYQSFAPQWWPADGVDIDIKLLPTRPGKAVQLELKTTKPDKSGHHNVFVDLGQLWEYIQKPLSKQPFYAFPWPHWKGELITAARDRGYEPTELVVQRGGRGRGWWFGDWMVVMTARQVADVVREPLDEHDRRERGFLARLVQFDANKRDEDGYTAATWGSLGFPAAAPEWFGWTKFWSELGTCGQPNWPQIIRVPKSALVRGAEDLRPGDRYSRDEIMRIFQQPTDLFPGRRGNDFELATLEPDEEEGGFRVEQDHLDYAPTSEPGGDDEGTSPESHRLAVFIDSGWLSRRR